MKIRYYDTYEQMSDRARDMIVMALVQNKKALICAATGNSPLKTYQLLAENYQKEPTLFEQMRLLKLDEWGGVPMEDAQTCESFLQENLVKPLNISTERYFTFASNPTDPKAECERIQTIIEQQGPIDLCILGLGMNGHLGFNEPAETLTPHAHVATLSPKSLQHAMANAMKIQPTYGITLGMRDILQSKKIILLITGSNKKEAVEKLLAQKISTYLPASFLLLHPDVECLIDKKVMNDII